MPVRAGSSARAGPSAAGEGEVETPVWSFERALISKRSQKKEASEERREGGEESTSERDPLREKKRPMLSKSFSQQKRRAVFSFCFLALSLSLSLSLSSRAARP